MLALNLSFGHRPSVASSKSPLQLILPLNLFVFIRRQDDDYLCIRLLYARPHIESLFGGSFFLFRLPPIVLLDVVPLFAGCIVQKAPLGAVSLTDSTEASDLGCGCNCDLEAVLGCMTKGISLGCVSV